MNKRKFYTSLLSLLLVLPLAGCAGKEERAWNKGQNALVQENYSEAAASFDKAGSFRDAERLLKYAEASQNLENGDYTQAHAGFQALGDFKDSVMMCSYCEAREQETLMQEAFSSGDTDLVIHAGMEAYTRYYNLPLFRDCDTRAAECRDLLYTKASEWMNQGSYDAAAAGFAALGDWQDCAAMRQYCQALSLEKQGSYTEAAALFTEISDVLDADARADAAYQHAYQIASDLKNAGDYEAALSAFAALGSYRDAAEQRDSSTAALVRERLQAGSYADALEKLNRLSDLSVFPEVDPDTSGNMKLFLDSFCNVWLNAHAGVMNAFFSCNLLQPYLVPGGELDTLIRTEITDDGAMLNYGYMYLGSEIKQLRQLDDGFTAAWMHGSASWGGAEGSTEHPADLLVLLDTTMGNPLAAAVLPLSTAGTG